MERKGILVSFRLILNRVSSPVDALISLQVFKQGHPDRLSHLSSHQEMIHSRLFQRISCASR